MNDPFASKSGSQHVKELQHRQYLTAKEAAAYLKSSASTLAKRRLSKNGPPFVRIGRAIRYAKHDLDAWMDSTRNTHAVSKQRDPGAST